MEWYIYYRTACDKEQDLQRRVLAMQTALSERHGVVAELKRRPQPHDGQHTWMEIYRRIPDGFDAILMQALGAAEVLPLIDGARHTEVFMDVPCA